MIFGRRQDKNGEEPTEQKENQQESLYGRLKSRLKKTRSGFVDQIQGLLNRWKAIDDLLFDELEEILIRADVGIQTTMEIVEDLKETVQKEGITEPAELEDLLKDKLIAILDKEEQDLIANPDGLNIVMVVGVNGSGKTTTIAKLAQRFMENGDQVLLAAADTFRAGAIEQITSWGNRLGIPVISHEEGSDPGAVAYDAIQAARARGADQLIIDTAGRLHTQKNLMEELKKIRRIIERESGGATVEVLLVIDATVGQNGINQARLFDEAVSLTGVVLTKLDGTAKGGVIVAIANEFELPVKMIGIGESAQDLRDFHPHQFVSALFGDEA